MQAIMRPYGSSWQMKQDKQYPVTPDGRYFVVRGRLWRRSDPSLPPSQMQSLMADLMSARRAVKIATNDVERRAARAIINEAKHALGERGPVWWGDGAPDYNRHFAKNSPYAAWFASSKASQPGRVQYVRIVDVTGLHRRSKMSAQHPYGGRRLVVLSDFNESGLHLVRDRRCPRCRTWTHRCSEAPEPSAGRRR